jgi:hypothetical protein
MSGSNLFRMDDFLLKGALWLGVLVAIIVLSVFSAASENVFSVSAGQGLGLFAFSVSPIAMGIVGYGVRRREKRAVSLWRLIERDVEISSRDLFRDSDWTAPLLERAVRDLNNAGVAYVVWDRQAGLVQNGRLRRSTLVVDECSACSNKMSLRVTIGSTSVLRCPYCHEPIDITRVAEEKARLIDELEADPPGALESHAAPHASGQEKSEFSVVIFILLFSVFWPAALWYCFRHRSHLVRLVG